MLLGSVWHRKNAIPCKHGFLRIAKSSESKIVRHAKYVGNHDWSRWTPSSLVGTPEKFMQRVLKINASTKSLVERLCDFKIYAISVLSFVGSVVHPTRQPSRPRTMPFSVQPQARVTPYHLRLLELTPFVASALIWWAFIPSALRLAIDLQHAHPHFAEALKRSVRLVDNCSPLFALSLPLGNMSFPFPPWLPTQRMHLHNDTHDEVPQNR